MAARSSKATRPSTRPRATITWASPPAAAIPAVTVSRKAGSVIASRAPEKPMMCSSSAAVLAVLDGTSVAPSRANANQATRNSGELRQVDDDEVLLAHAEPVEAGRDPVHALLERPVAELGDPALLVLVGQEDLIRPLGDALGEQVVQRAFAHGI